MTTSDFLDGILGTDSNSVEDAKIAEERAASLASALDQLTLKQRFVIERAWGITDGTEYSFRDIALMMGIAWQSVQQHYHLGMAKLTNACQLAA